MKYIIGLSLTVLLSASAMAQPSIATNGVVNAASFAKVGLPNSNIAQGSFFTIFGSNLGPTTSPSLAFPLKTNLGGVSVSVSAGGQNFDAIPLFVGPGQINAVLPSKTPTGPATATVTYNGTSNAASFQVVPHSFGIFSVAQSGAGPGVIDDVNYHIFTLTSAGEAGAIGIIWGTGLTAVEGDEAAGPLPGDRPDVPAEVYVGLEKATITYRGRSGCCVGVDQIFFKFPAGVTGCHVPVAVKIGDIVSNFVTVPISQASANGVTKPHAASALVCSDSTGPSSGDIATFLTKGGSFGSVFLDRTTSTSPGLPPPFGTGKETTTTIDGGSASFYRYMPQQLNAAQNPFQTFTIATCTVFEFGGQSATVVDPIKPVGLDAGAKINVNGTNGAKQLLPAANIKGTYFATLGGGTPPNATPLYLDQGSYAIDNGAGGVDVKSFKFNITVPPPLTWTNMGSVGPVIRANGQLITWTGGDPSGTVTISGDSVLIGSNPNGSDTVGAFFTCYAPDSAGQFTIPPLVLLSLPPSSVIMPGGGVSIDTGSLSVGTFSVPVQFTAPGLDFGFAGSLASAGKTLGYK
jgi:uncharacterized protein (TIGR03437 family)